jgi:hypothetical protein
LPADEGELLGEDLRVGLRATNLDALPPELVGIDLMKPRLVGVGGPLTEAFREFLRKRGIRLEPRTWTYRGGWL